MFLKSQPVMDFFPDGSGRSAERSWPLCIYILIIYSEPSCHIQRENLLLVWPAPILIFSFPSIYCVFCSACILLCFLCSAASLPLTQRRTSSPSKPSPSCLQWQSSSLAALIPWSSLRTAWSCPRGKDLKAPGTADVALWVLWELCATTALPQGEWVPWASSLKCAPHLQLFSKFSCPYGSCAASDD